MTTTIIVTLVIALVLILLMVRNVTLTKQFDEQKTAEPHEQKFKEVPLNTPDWVKNAVIYQVNIRQFSPEGTFNAFAEHLERIAALGVDMIWFMPIYPLCDTNKKCHPEADTECIGSHYAVYDYFSINPRYGTPEDFRNIVKKIHDLGMKVILDFVPNHTGWDSRWMLRHPEWFKKDKAGNIISPIKKENGESWGWDDVAQLDYSNMRMRENVIQAHEFWMREFNVDGFREDVAGEVPTFFWKELRHRLEKIRPVYMLSEDEVEGQEHFNVCFNTNYAWQASIVMKDIAKGEKPASALYEWTETVKQKFGTRGWQMNYTQNHDENTWNGTEKELFGVGADCYTALTFVMEGMPMIYNGQEASLDKRLWFFNKDEIDWSDLSRAAFFKTLIDLKHRNKALWNGQNGGVLQKLSTDKSDDKIYAFFRQKEEYQCIAIFNLSDKKVNDILRGGIAAGTYKNVFTGETKNIAAATTLSLEPYDYLILSNV
ncbi:MAG: alpha-glucosidase C-terminal domain-containing protein [Saprospiraceae bacterium]|nr:alpha-glucosidase C-terminal domain-containing protein [Saprospiraceae bacterium]